MKIVVKCGRQGIKMLRICSFLVKCNKFHLFSEQKLRLTKLLKSLREKGKILKIEKNYDKIKILARKTV